MRKTNRHCLMAIVCAFYGHFLPAQTVKELYNVGLPGISSNILVPVTMFNGKGYLGGDIEVGDEETLLRNDLFFRNNPNVMFAPLALRMVKWDGGVVPIVISGFNNVEVNAIVNALNELMDHTNVSFVKKTDNHENYVEIINDPNLGFEGGSSIIGKSTTDSVQYIRLNMPRIISSRVVIHEMIHALAFYHEHQRSDRDNYIEIIEENIYPPEKVRNFIMLPPSAASTALPYDCSSIMHYDSIAFGRISNGNRLATIIPRPDVVCNPIGGNVLSTLDIKAINDAYPVQTSNTRLEVSDFLSDTPVIIEAWMVQNGRMIDQFVRSCSTCSSTDPEQYQLNITGSGLVGWDLDRPSYMRASSIITSSNEFLKINILFKYDNSAGGNVINTLRLKNGTTYIDIPISTPFIVLD